eukprot:gb/GEZN01010488.1/.p1 GENE.gb/GEZN01010488.1/~~gb/GEZN01010488.1/.p1  ORF type:complete len:386 (+),score=40.55 gb/GEZN01010488.1/:37-1194(+)
MLGRRLPSFGRQLVRSLGQRGLAIDTCGPGATGVDKAFTKKNPYGLGQAEMTYAGALSFMRRRYSKDLEGVHLTVCGVPFDNAVTNRPGARLGPRAIRAASTQLAELKSFPWGVDPFEDYCVTDYGDCFVNPHMPDTVVPDITAHARTILTSGTKMLTLGGDHFVSYPLIKAHVQHLGYPIALLHFDAHCDTWPDNLDWSEGVPPAVRIDHGSMFYRAVKEGLVLPKSSVQVGLRTWNDDNLGFNILDAPFVHEQGLAATKQRLKEVFRAGLAAQDKAVCGERLPLYVTFDIDCLDPAAAPGTGTPVAGGLSSAQALSILRALANDAELLQLVNLVGADVVEVSPPFDVSELTALAAAHVASDLIHVFRAHHLRDSPPWIGHGLT